jgi:hypothetical protein
VRYDIHTIDVGTICNRVPPAQFLILFQEFRTLSFPGTTSTIHSLPVLNWIQQTVSETIAVQYSKSSAWLPPYYLLHVPIPAVTAYSINVSHNQYYKQRPIMTIQLPDFQ